jgi:thiamine biosynthesis lipoprotein
MLHVLKDVQNLLGTFVTITVVHSDRGEGISALSAAFGEIRRIQDLMNVHKSDSEVGVLNRSGFYEGLSDDTKFVIQRANDFSERSDGAFDITVLPILELWREKARESNLPTDEEIGERLGLVNYREVWVENGNVRFGASGMGMTLAGVAKGYAVDKAVEALRQAHIKHGLVNAGGDIRVLGGRTDTQPWKIGIRDPKNKTGIVTTVDLVDRAIATSGTYQRSFNDILCPKTGRPVQGGLSSTIIAGTAMDADILATCMLVSGAEKGYELLEDLNGIKAFIMKDDGTVLN